MTRTPTRAVLAATTLALLTVLGGCGGDDGLTAKEFRAEADKLCTEADKDTEALGEGLTDSSSEAEVQEAIDKLVDRTEQLYDDIDELEAPEELEEDVDSMLAEVRKGLDKIDDATIEELGAMEDPFAKANEKAEELGLDACAD